MTASQIMFFCTPYVFGFFMVSILFVFAVPLDTKEWLSKGVHKNRKAF